MPIPEFDLDILLGKVEKILKKTKPKPPDPTIVTLCEVIASLVLEVERLRGSAAVAVSAPPDAGPPA